MNRNQEADLFELAMSSVRNVQSIPNLSGVSSMLFERGRVIWPTGTAYSRPGCALLLYSEYEPENPNWSMARTMGAARTLYLYKDGTNVMERTGALTALRRETEG